MSPLLGFSVKSQAGGNSTLINAGKTTNFIFKIVGTKFSDDKIDQINNMTKKRGSKQVTDVKGRINRVVDLGGKLSFHDVARSVFKANLSLIDSQLPEILGNVVKEHFTGSSSIVSVIVDKLEKENPVGFDTKHGHLFYAYKIKRLLTDSALGMLPSKVWDGAFEANGGYIVLKQDGEILCYHLYEKDLFENYLFNNTKLDSPSASKHDYGYLFREGGELFMKLCLQIRFIT